ncbi:hypothetical protein JOE48_003715 [Methylobacterium sp. PvR107]|nr:hypothetical protein [Methylobacterium sp. PvR107]
MVMVRAPDLRALRVREPGRQAEAARHRSGRANHGGDQNRTSSHPDSTPNRPICRQNASTDCNFGRGS